MAEKIVRFTLLNSSYRILFLKVRFGTKKNPNPDNKDIKMVEVIYDKLKSKYPSSYISKSSDGMKGVFEVKIPLDMKSQTTQQQPQQQPQPQQQAQPSAQGATPMNPPKMEEIIKIVGACVNTAKNNKYEVSDDNVEYLKSQLARYEDGLKKRMDARNKGGDTSILRSQMFLDFKAQLSKDEIQQLKGQIKIAPLSATSEIEVSAIKALKYGKFSDDNIILAVMQWRNAGRTGSPSFLLTEIQWQKMYNRGIKQDALEIRLVNPDDMGGYDAAQAEQATGMNARQASRIGKAVHKGFLKSAYKFKSQTKFHEYSYYDETDTFPLQAGVDEFGDDFVMGNIDEKPNKKAEEILAKQGISIQSDSDSDSKLDKVAKEIQERAATGFTTSSINLSYLKKAFAELEKENPQLYGGITRQSLEKALETYLSHADFIDREKDKYKKQEKLCYAMIFAVGALKLDANLFTKLIGMVGKDSLDPNNQMYADAWAAVEPLIQDVERINNAITESKNNITESFVNAWNKIVETKQKFYNELYD